MGLTEEEVGGVREALSAIVGQPLSDMWRYAGCQKFEFGEQRPFVNRKGEESTQADHGLVVSCDWSIEGPDGFRLGSEHFGRTPDLWDEHAKPFYESLDDAPPVVESVDVQESGGLRIGMTRGYSLAVDPDPPEEDHIEDWRFMPREGDPRGHLALRWDGLGWSGD